MDVERWKDGADGAIACCCIASHLVLGEKTRLAVFPRAEADGAFSASRARSFSRCSACGCREPHEEQRAAFEGELGSSRESPAAALLLQSVSCLRLALGAPASKVPGIDEQRQLRPRWTSSSTLASSPPPRSSHPHICCATLLLSGLLLSDSSSCSRPLTSTPPRRVDVWDCAATLAPRLPQRPTRDGRSRTRQASTHPRGLDVGHLGLHAAATTVCASLFDLQASSFRFPAFHLPLEAAASARAAARQPHSARTRAGAGIAASWR